MQEKLKKICVCQYFFVNLHPILRFRKKSMKEIIIVILLVGLSIALLAVRIIIKKDGQFSSEDVGQSRAMRDRGIGCTRTQDRQARRVNPNRIDVKKY